MRKLLGLAALAAALWFLFRVVPVKFSIPVYVALWYARDDVWRLVTGQETLDAFLGAIGWRTVPQPQPIPEPIPEPITTPPTSDQR